MRAGNPVIDGDWNLVVCDLQNGMMNENTDYLPSVLSSFLSACPFHLSRIVFTMITEDDGVSWPGDRDNKAGITHTLSDDFNNSLVAPFPRSDDMVVRHASYTDIASIMASCDGRNVLLCGLETDSIMITGMALQDRGYHVKIMYDLTATTLGTGAQIALMPVMQHLFGDDNIL